MCIPREDRRIETSLMCLSTLTIHDCIHSRDTDSSLYPYRDESGVSVYSRWRRASIPRLYAYRDEYVDETYETRLYQTRHTYESVYERV